MITESTNISSQLLCTAAKKQGYRAMAKWCMVLLLVFTSVQKAMAQLSLRLSDSHITLKSKTLNTFTIRVINQSNTAQSANLKITPDESVQLISQSNIPIQLNAGDSIYVPVKIFNRAELAIGVHSVHVFLQQGDKIIQEGECTLETPAKKSATLFATVPSIQLLGNEDSLVIPVQVSNTGNVPTSISILANIAADRQNQIFHKPVKLRLKAYSDTLLYITKRVPRSLASSSSFNVNILGFYENGDQFGQANVQVNLLESLRTEPYAPPPPYITNVPNSVTVTAQNALSNNGYYWLNGGSSIYLPNDARIAYNADAIFYQFDPGNPYLNNTWLNYESHGRGATIGNISRNFDLNMYGRGASMYIMDSAHQNYFEGGVMDNASNLLQAANTIYSQGRSGWGEFRHKTDSLTFQSVAIYQKDPLTQSNNLLLTNDFNWVTKKHFHFSTSLNSGNSSDQQNPSNQKSGMLASFSASGNIGKWNINSVNTYSTPYYAGQRKGARNFSERISYRLNKVGIWGAYSYYSYQPKYVSSLYNYQSKYSSTHAEVGASTNWSHFSLSLSPNYTSTSSLFFMSTGALSAKISSWRIATQVNYNAINTSVYLNTETGIGKNSLTNKSEFQFLLNTNLRYRFFSINSNIQLGDIYASDALNNYLTKRSRYEIVNISSNVHKEFFDNKLYLNAALSYNYYSTTGRNISLNGTAQYKISPKSSVSATYMRYTIGATNYSYNNLQLSYTQQIPEARIGSRKNTLVVFFYKDINNNGIYDAADSIAKGQEVSINNTAFISGKDGKIVYKNLATGSYIINTLYSGKWYGDQQTIILDKKKLSISIPLHKTGTIEGNITYNYNKYSYEVSKQKQGVTIQAIDANGKIVTTLTDDYGHYILYLPTGNYSVSVDNNSLSNEVECANNGQDGIVTPNSYKAINFVLNVKERHIETKKFYSSSLVKADPQAEEPKEPKSNPKPDLK